MILSATLISRMVAANPTALLFHNPTTENNMIMAASRIPFFDMIGYLGDNYKTFLYIINVVTFSLSF